VVPVSDGAPAAPAVEFLDVSKTFPGQRALSNVSFSVRPGEIHALLGQNGSGKSTLIKILAGIYSPDPGATVRVAGERLALGSPRESRRIGLRFVHQALGIIEDLTALENVALTCGYRRRGGRLIDWNAQRAKTRRLLEQLSIDVDIDVPVSRLRPVERSAIAIARAIDDDEGAIRVLVLDEPTAALPPSEVESLFQLVRQARASGTAIIYVSHRLNEIFDLADRATILRDGIRRQTVTMADLSHSDLIQAIVGEALTVDLPLEHPVRPPSDDVPALHVDGLQADRLHDVTFSVGAGEIVGIAGLTGSGREELAGALIGERPAHVRLRNGQGKTCVDPSPRQAKQLGVVLVLPNRAAGAAVKELSIRENLMLPSMDRYTRFGFTRRRPELQDSLRWIEALDIRPRDPERAYGLLSGGNQQKVAFGKWLNLDPQVIVAEDPTSGVDIGARNAIYNLMREQARAGKAFIVVSSDAEDLLAVCDRILVLRDGTIADELVGSRIGETELLSAIVGTPSTP
jgi:ribose transport system ATP-binding protein